MTELDAHGFRRDEGYAAAVVRHVLGAKVEPLDVPGAAQRTVDAEVTYPDGRTAALEVTSVEAPEVHWLRAKIAALKSTPAPGALGWIIRPSSVDELNRYVEVHQAVILACEAHGVRRPDHLPLDLLDEDATLYWAAYDTHETMSAVDMKPGKPPKVYWSHPGGSAVWSDDGEAIWEGVAAALKVEPALGHIAKLLHDPHDERHLFLIVGMTGLSTAAAFALIEAESLPTSDPELPAGLDHLWLGPGWGGTVTIWSRGRGWRNERIAEPPVAGSN